jgi:hypothetical protein
VATDVRVINGFRDESNGTNVSGRLANNENAHVLALTPARLESEAVADAVRCDVLVNPNGGYEALGWFTYDGDPPAACHLLSDLFKGDFTSMDWTSVDQLIALFVCVCPMVLSTIATAAALGLGWMVRTRGRTLYRLKAKAKQRALQRHSGDVPPEFHRNSAGIPVEQPRNSTGSPPEFRFGIPPEFCNSTKPGLCRRIPGCG